MEIQSPCSKRNQREPKSSILEYGAGGFNTLNQNLYSGVYFLMQVVVLLNDLKKGFIDGKFALAQQTPRAQSRSIV